MTLTMLYLAFYFPIAFSLFSPPWQEVCLTHLGVTHHVHCCRAYGRCSGSACVLLGSVGFEKQVQLPPLIPLFLESSLPSTCWFSNSTPQLGRCYSWPLTSRTTYAYQAIILVNHENAEQSQSEAVSSSGLIRHLSGAQRRKFLLR